MERMHRLRKEGHLPLGLIICDVDNLKFVNDNYGHDSRDKLLTEIARLLKKSMRKSDVIARIGGDEFAMLLPNRDREAVESTYKRIRCALNSYNSDSPFLPLSISTGCSVRVNEDQRMDEVFKEADDHMYSQKLIHRNRLGGNLLKSFLKADSAHRFELRGQLERIGRPAGRTENQSYQTGGQTRRP